MLSYSDLTNEKQLNLMKGLLYQWGIPKGTESEDY